MTRGMTRDRFAEIKRQLDGAPDYAIAKELVRWIDNEGGLMDFDEPPKPVVIDGPGRYWFKGDNGIEEVDVTKEGDYWVARGYKDCYTGSCFDSDGKLGVHPWRILAPVVYRERPLRPEEAFKLLGKKLRHAKSGYCCDIYSVGEKGVHLRRWNEYPIDPSNWGFPYEVTFEELASQYRNDYGVDPFVREPVPFSEATA